MIAAENGTFQQIGEFIKAAHQVVVVSHMRPDGDALGCSLALGLALRGLGKKVTVWNDDGLPERSNWLPGAELLTRPPSEPQDFDLAIIIDTATEQRLGTALPAFRAPKRINIDHHISNERFGDLVYVDPSAPASGQILFELFAALNIPIVAAIAENLFVAISTDTGSFQYPATTARTYEIGAALIRLGADVGRISRDLYENYPLRRIELLRSLLNEMTLSSNGQAASVSLSLAETERLGALPDDHEGLIDHIRAIQGVQVAAFFEELAEGRVRVSMRSKDARFNVCTICGVFGGGGHALASGARIRGSLAEVREKVLQQIDHEITRNT